MKLSSSFLFQTLRKNRKRKNNKKVKQNQQNRKKTMKDRVGKKK